MTGAEMEKRAGSYRSRPPASLRAYNSTPGSACQGGAEGGPGLELPSPRFPAVPAPIEYRNLLHIETGELASGTDPALGLSNAHIALRFAVVTASGGRFVQLLGDSGDRETPGGGPRGEVSTFTRQARRRMMQLFSQLRVGDVTDSALLLTLTYPRLWPHDPETWHDQFNRLWARLEKRHPGAACIWRLEFQERGAPHFHVLLLNVPFLSTHDLTTWWRDIAHVDDEFHGQAATRVERPYSWFAACAYLYKYMSKLDGYGLPARTGRLWGVRRPDLLPIRLATRQLTGAQFTILKAWLLLQVPPAMRSGLSWSATAGMWSMQDERRVQRAVELCVAGEVDEYLIDRIINAELALNP